MDHEHYHRSYRHRALLIVTQAAQNPIIVPAAYPSITAASHWSLVIGLPSHSKGRSAHRNASISAFREQPFEVDQVSGGGSSRRVTARQYPAAGSAKPPLQKLRPLSRNLLRHVLSQWWQLKLNLWLVHTHQCVCQFLLNVIEARICWRLDARG